MLLNIVLNVIVGFVPVDRAKVGQVCQPEQTEKENKTNRS